MLEKMQGFAAHTFAAVMTFTVLTFPTPTDLRQMVSDQFTDEKLVEIRSFPTLEAEDPPTNVMVETEAFFPIVEACIIATRGLESPETEGCQNAIKILSENTGSEPTIARIIKDQQTLEVATAFYCRSKWTQATETGRTFDLTDCMGSNLTVAPSVD